MIPLKRLLTGLIALAFAATSVADAQTYRPGFGFSRPGFQFLSTGVAVAATTWNPADKSAGLTLSNNNLTVSDQNDGSYQNVRAVKSLSAGKKYFESAPSGAASSTHFPALATSAEVISANTTWGRTTNSVSVQPIIGRVVYNNTATTIGGDGSSVIGIAVDLSAGLFWVSINGVWQFGNPSAGTGGVSIGTGKTWFPGVQISGGVFTANFGGSAFLYTPPSGFSPWG